MPQNKGVNIRYNTQVRDIKVSQKDYEFYRKIVAKHLMGTLLLHHNKYL